jgi:hypothetical protein
MQTLCVALRLRKLPQILVIWLTSIRTDVWSWIGIMAALPYHGAVFASKEAAGYLRPDNGGVPISQRFDPAAKIGVAVLQAAQKASLDM